jgi:carbamate kinase
MMSLAKDQSAVLCGGDAPQVGQSQIHSQRATESDFSVKMLVTRNVAWPAGPVGKGRTGKIYEVEKRWGIGT